MNTATNREAGIVAAAMTHGERLGSTLWHVEIGGTVYYIHERYDPRSGKTWHTAHVGAENGPRVSNS